MKMFVSNVFLVDTMSSHKELLIENINRSTGAHTNTQPDPTRHTPTQTPIIQTYPYKQTHPHTNTLTLKKSLTYKHTHTDRHTPTQIDTHIDTNTHTHTHTHP